MAGGDFVVVYYDDRDENDYYEIMARGFKKDGTQRFAEITVNTASKGSQYDPDVACGTNGFVVVWYDDHTDDVRARGFDWTGAEIIREFRVGVTGSGGYSPAPRIAMAQNGTFAITWTAGGNIRVTVFDRSGRTIVAERSASYVNPDIIDLSGEWINAPGTGFHSSAVAIAFDGRFVVAYQREGGYTYFRSFHPDGFIALGDPFPVPVSHNLSFSGPSVSIARNGRTFTVAESMVQQPVRALVYSHRFNWDGTRLFPPTSTTQSAVIPNVVHTFPDVVTSMFDQMLIVWLNQDGLDIQARIFDDDNQPEAQEFWVNSNLSGEQHAPSIDTDGYHNFVVVWQDDNDGNGYYEIMGRGFNLTTGTETFHDKILNSVSQGQQLAPRVAVVPSFGYLDIMIEWKPVVQAISPLFWIVFRSHSREMQRILRRYPVIRDHFEALCRPIVAMAHRGDNPLTSFAITEDVVKAVRQLLRYTEAVPKSPELTRTFREFKKHLQEFQGRTLGECVFSDLGPAEKEPL